MKKHNKQGYPVIRLLIIISMSLLIVIIIGLITFDNTTVLALQQINYYYLFTLFLLWLSLGFIDALSLFLYARGFSKEMTLFRAFRAVSIRIFYNIITPFNFGGQPAVVKELTRYNITYGNGYSIVFNKLFIYTCVSTIGGILSFFLYKQHIDLFPGLEVIFFISGILSVLFASLFILGFIFPKIVIIIGGYIERLLNRLKIIKSGSRFKIRLIREVITARKTFSLFFSRNLLYFITGTLCIILHYIGRIILFWFILKSIGINIDFSEGCVLSALILFLISFIPTPGSIGLGEALVAFLAFKNIPINLLGIVLISWRFFYQYLGAIIGVFFSVDNVAHYLMSKAKKNTFSPKIEKKGITSLS